jgi:invasion protein IalB
MAGDERERLEKPRQARKSRNHYGFYVSQCRDPIRLSGTGARVARFVRAIRQHLRAMRRDFARRPGQVGERRRAEDRVTGAIARAGHRCLIGLPPWGPRMSTMAIALVWAAAPAFGQAPTRPQSQPAQPRPVQTTPVPPAAGGPPRLQDAPELIYSPWAKFCAKGADPAAKQVCFTGRDARTETGRPVAAATLIEPEGDAKTFLRVTVQNPVRLEFGTRIFVDQNPVQTAKFFTCFVYGCSSEFEATPEIVAQLKSGQTLIIQAINLEGDTITVSIPLSKFKEANEGPPTDAKVFEDQEKRLQDELRKRAEELRKRMEPQQGAQAPKP